MPRIQLGILVLAAIVIGAAPVDLYGIGTRPVHVSAALPSSLSPLKREFAAKIEPPAAFLDGAGRSRSLASFRGRIVILNLWATWCAPCVRELPALGRLSAAVPPGRFAVVAVNAGREDAAATARFLKAHGAGNLAVYRDPDLALLQVFGAQGLPFSVVIDSEGREIARASGPLDWDDPAAIVYFRSLAAHVGP